MRVESLVGLGLEAEALGRVQRGQLAELDAVGGLLDGQAVDRVDAHDRVVLLAALAVVALARLADRADDGVTLAQVVLLDLAERDVDVVVAREVAAGAHEGVVVENVEDARDRDEHVILGDLGLEVVADAGRGRACGRGSGCGRRARRPRSSLLLARGCPGCWRCWPLSAGAGVSLR